MLWQPCSICVPMCFQWHKAQFKLDPHFLFLFNLNALMWWQNRICKFEKPNCKAYNTHLVKRFSKVFLESTTPTPPKDFLAQQSPSYCIANCVLLVCPKTIAYQGSSLLDNLLRSTPHWNEIPQWHNVPPHFFLCIFWCLIELKKSCSMML